MAVNFDIEEVEIRIENELKGEIVVEEVFGFDDFG